MPPELSDAWLMVNYTPPDQGVHDEPFSSPWRVKLKGNDADLVQLPPRFAAPPIEFCVIDGSYYLILHALERVTDPNEAVQIVAEQLETINGVLRLLNAHARPVNWDQLVRRNDDGSFWLVARASEIGTLRDPTPPDPSSVTGVEQHLTALAARDPAVKHFLRLMGKKGPDPVMLYKLYEIIRDDVGGDQAITKERGWTSKAELSRFTGSMNNYNLYKDDARHATRKHPVPRRPMTLEEGDRFIRRLLARWLTTKRL